MNTVKIKEGVGEELEIFPPTEGVIIIEDNNYVSLQDTEFVILEVK